MENRDIRFLLNLQMLADGIRKSFPVQIPELHR